MTASNVLLPNVLLPNKERNLEGARIDPSAVLSAVEILELARPVEIKWAAGIYRRGSHRVSNGRHIITLSTYYPAEEVSRTLWHELVHCHQSESAGSETAFRAAYAVESARFGYRGNRFEIEARDIASDFTSSLPLAS